MKKRFIACCVFIFPLFAYTQHLPPCIDTAGRNGKPRPEIIGTVRLPNGQTVFKKSIKRPPRCMDCASGVVYIDSLCGSVASFTIGFAPVAAIQPGYEAKWFPESSSPAFAKSIERANAPRSYEVKSVTTGKSPLTGLAAGDQLEISMAAGLKHFRGKQLINQYKIIPQQVNIITGRLCPADTCPPGITRKQVYYLEPAGRFIVVELGSNGMAFRQTKQPSGPGEPVKPFTNGDWEDVYLLQVVYGQ